MKNLCKCLFCLMLCAVSVGKPNSVCRAEEKVPKELDNGLPKLAIVIDDFGEDRVGVETMLSLDIKFTGAVIPFMEFSESDANRLNERGKEVMLHMPMEAYGNLPYSWYGSTLIKNSYSRAEARDVLLKSIDSLPFVKGVNIHMGTAVSQNPELADEILNVAKEKGLGFLDSKTIEGSVFPQIAEGKGVKFAERDLFLEVSGQKSYEFSRRRIEEAVELAKKNGRAILIGHVGPVGGETSANALKDCEEYLKASGVQLVGFSELF